jgi:hypothetical protein
MKKSIFLFFALSVLNSVSAQSDSLTNKQLPINIFKFNFFSPLRGHSMFSFEKGIKYNRSIEFSLSVIGAGANQNYLIQYTNTNNQFTPNYVYGKSQLGGALGFGYRFYMPSRSYKKAKKQQPTQTEFYFKPTIYSGYYRDNPMVSRDYLLDDQNVFSLGFLFETGVQEIIGKIIAIDLYGGFGYGLVNTDFRTFNDANSFRSAFGTNENAYHYTHIRYGRTVGLSLSGGIRVGVVSRKKVKNKK